MTRTRPARTFTVGVFLQANFGRRPQLTIAGVPVGKEIPGEVYKEESGSFIAVVATDAPLLPHQLKRLARRVSLGLARTGTISGNGSGDLFIAFSTANPNAASPDQITHSVETIPNDLNGSDLRRRRAGNRRSGRQCVGRQPSHDRPRQSSRRRAPARPVAGNHEAFPVSGIIFFAKLSECARVLASLLRVCLRNESDATTHRTPKHFVRNAEMLLPLDHRDQYRHNFCYSYLENL